MRTLIAKAILKAFEEDFNLYKQDYNPDTCYRAADYVLKTIVHELTGQVCTLTDSVLKLGTRVKG